MRTSLLLTFLAVLVFSNAAVVKSPASRANLSVGIINYGDRLLYSQYVYQPPRVNTIQYQDLIYRGNLTTRVTAVRATEVGYTQYAAAWIISGGINQNNVTIRVQSARGYGYYYQIDIWGR